MIKLIKLLFTYEIVSGYFQTHQFLFCQVSLYSLSAIIDILVILVKQAMGSFELVLLAAITKCRLSAIATASLLGFRCDPEGMILLAKVI